MFLYVYFYRIPHIKLMDLSVKCVINFYFVSEVNV